MTYTLASVNYKLKALACILVHKHGSFWYLKLLQLLYMSAGTEQRPIQLAQDRLRGQRHHESTQHCCDSDHQQ